MKFKVTLVLFFLIFAFAGVTAAGEYVPLPGIVHVYSTVSSGLYSIEELVAMAKEKGLKAIVLTDHSLVALEIGSFPLRNLIKKKVEKKSVIRMGPEKYLALIDQINQRQKDVIVIPGVQAAPFYYWTGSPFHGNLTAHDYRKELLIVGLRSADDYRHLPLLHRGFSTRYVKDLLPQSIILLLVFLMSIYLLFQKKVLKITGIVLGSFSLVLILNHHPFQSSRFDPYHGDQGIAPYQELIDYVQKQGGLTFWAHPESNYSKTEKIGSISIVTTPYANSLSSASGYTGFSAIYADAAKLTDPGKQWDQLLNEYCRGEKSRPVWGIAGANFRGNIGGVQLDRYQTIFLVRRQTEKEILEAFSKGRIYAREKGEKTVLSLDEFRVYDKKGGSAELMGGELHISTIPMITGKLSAGDGGHYQARVLLIKGGQTIQSFEGKTPMAFVFEDPEFLTGKTYYRLNAQGQAVGKVISNPIFVDKKSGKISSGVDTGKFKKGRPAEIKGLVDTKAAVDEAGKKPGQTSIQTPAAPKKPAMTVPREARGKISRSKVIKLLEKKEKVPSRKISRPKKTAVPSGKKQKKIEQPPVKSKKKLVGKKITTYPYSLQMASFPTLKKARQLITRYKDFGLPLYYAKVNLGKRGIWWRVFVGHFKTQAEAMKVRRENKLLDSMVRKTPYANLIGVTTSETETIGIRKRLTKANYSPYVIKYNDGRFHILVGAFITLKGARTQKSELQTRGFRSKIVKR